ncbi:MAG: hypothetical protein K2N03_07790 [Muribaculaceae bacterium]|nr:hypothetical protein [Muribaculaceae bacterium]
MRILTDTEIAERMVDKILSLKTGEYFSTEILLKQIPITVDELLPVGDLSGIHNLLMQKINGPSVEDPIIEEIADNRNRYILPYKRQYKRL